MNWPLKFSIKVTNTVSAPRGNAIHSHFPDEGGLWHARVLLLVFPQDWPSLTSLSRALGHLHTSGSHFHPRGPTSCGQAKGRRRSFCITWRCFCEGSRWDRRKGEIDPVPGHENFRADLTRRRLHCWRNRCWTLNSVSDDTIEFWLF